MSDLEALVRRWRSLGERIIELRDEQDQLEREICELIGPGIVTIPGLGAVRRRAHIARRAWDTSALLRAVLDSRRVDRATGEILVETPLERVLHVWGLYTPRVTALQERGIDPDEYCETERRGWRLDFQGG